ncbi:unnamed protein product, partial [Aduncisulcus paluster]
DDFFTMDDDNRCTVLDCGSTCTTHGTCLFLEDLSDVECVCDSGWEGTSCGSQTCVNDCVHGECILESTYKCDCENSYWTGDACDELQCPDCGFAANGCALVDDTRVCICDEGWAHTPSAVIEGTAVGDIVPCYTPVSLEGCNHGNWTYNSMTDELTCECLTGWDYLGTDYDNCNDPTGCVSTCEHGSCSYYEGDFGCSCDTGWDGDACDTPVGCEPLCLNGTCAYDDVESSFYCDCSSSADWEADDDGSCQKPAGCGGDCLHGICTYDFDGEVFECYCDENWAIGEDNFCSVPDCDCGIGGSECTYNGEIFECECLEGWETTDTTFNSLGWSQCDSVTGCTMDCINGDCASGLDATDFFCNCWEYWAEDSSGQCTEVTCNNYCGSGSCVYSTILDVAYCSCDDGWLWDDEESTSIEDRVCIKPDCDSLCGANATCVYDIVTDTSGCVCDSGYENESFEMECTIQSCSPPCANGGVCYNGSCFCTDDWTGDFCEIPDCDCNGHGYCILNDSDEPECVCFSQWTGSDCSEDRCGTYNTLHGVCIDGVLVCTDNYEGDSCDTPPQGECTLDCLNGGYCSGQSCVCPSLYWTGDVCEIPICNLGDGCGSYGTCVENIETGNHECKCSYGYTLNGENQCEVLTCTPACSNGGSCTENDGVFSCDCEGIPWTGTTCNIPTCDGNCGDGACVLTDDDLEDHVCKCVLGYSVDPLSGDCVAGQCDPPCDPDHGTCNTEGAVPICECSNAEHWGGSDCSIPQCPDAVNACGPYGECVDNGDGTGACLCDLGWELGLTDCTSPTCDPICVNGTCISSSIDGKANVCECDAGYTGDDCNTVACIDMEAGHGICVNDVIYCSAGWGGDTCSDPVCTPECGHGSCQNEGAGAY